MSRPVILCVKGLHKGSHTCQTRLGGFTGCKTIGCALFDIDTVNMYTYSCTLL